MSVEPDKSAGCPTENDNCSIECGDCVKPSDNVSGEKKKIPRSVHFPDKDEIVTQYFEPANPWHNVPSTTRSQLAAEYLESCRRHNTPCIDSVLQQIRELPEASIGGVIRAPRLTLSECALLGPAPVDALEAVLRKVQFRRIEIDHAMIDDEGAEALFDMIEYYESATVVCISGPRQFGIRGWQAASRMIKKSAELSELEVTDSELEASHSPVLARSLRPLTCRLRALCLQRVELCGEPLLCLVIALKSNTSIRELRLGDNRLSIPDATQLANLIKYNNRIQLLDLSNNQIQDAGVGQLADAIAEQAAQSPPSAAASPLSPHRCQVGGHEARGLAFLVLWNNQLTRNCAPHLSKALRSCASLCVLNVGRNALGADVPRAICAGAGLVSLGLQAARLGPDAAHALADLIRHHTKLQRLDLRENRLGSSGLQAILNVMKDNTTVTQIDLDEQPESTNLSAEDSETSLVRRLTREIRTLCLRNEPLARPDGHDPMHRKISLTCHTTCLLRQGMGGEEEKRGRLRSPAPSPAPSPAGSPVPAPHPNSRFSVTRVTPERDSSSDSRPSTPTRPTYCNTPSRFRVEQVMEPPKIQVHPVSTPRKPASRFSVTRNYDTMYNPSPSPPASPAYNPPVVDSEVIATSAATINAPVIPKVVTAPVTMCPSFNPEPTIKPVRSVIDVAAKEDAVASKGMKNLERKEHSVKSLDSEVKRKSDVANTSKLTSEHGIKTILPADIAPSLQTIVENNPIVQSNDQSKLSTQFKVSDRSNTQNVLDSKSSSHSEVSNMPNILTEVSTKPTLMSEGNKSNVQCGDGNISSLLSKCEIGKETNKIFDIHKVTTQPEVMSRLNLPTNVDNKPVCQTDDINKDLQDKLGLRTDIDKKPVSQVCCQPPVQDEEFKKDIVKLKESVTLVKNTSDKIENLKETDKIVLNETVLEKCDIKHGTKDISVPFKYECNTDISRPECVTQITKDIPRYLEYTNKNVPTTDVLNDPTLCKNVAGILKSETTHKSDSEILENKSHTTSIEASSAAINTTTVELTRLKIENTFTDSTISIKDINIETLKTDPISKIVDDRDFCDAPNDKVLEKHQSSLNKSDTECKQPKTDVISEKRDLSDKVTESVKIVTSDLKYSDVVKNAVKQEQNRTIKQIVAMKEDLLGNIIKEMRILVKDNLETPVKDIVLKKNKSESSLDSPDLEVSRLTEKMSSVFDSSSSLEISGSSMESLNEHNKTVQELDRRKTGVILSGSSLESDVTPINNNLLNLSVSSNDSVSPIFGKTRVIHDSLSSLEASVSSLDSGKQDKVMVTSADSGIEFSLQHPTDNKEDNSSNEGTLTNNSSLKDTVKKPEVFIDSSTASPKRASSLLDVPALKNKGLDRMRKISWVAPSSSFNIPKPDEKEAKPSHLEKLLSLFQHPSSIFSRSSGSDDEKKSASSTPPRKDSTLTSSFWSWGSTIERDREEDSSEATDSTLSERVQVFFVDESFSRKLDSKTPSTDTDNTLSEFQSFPQESESGRDRVTVTTEDNIVQKVDLSVNSQDIDIAKNGAIDLLREKESVNVEKDDIARPRSFAAVLKASGSENSLDKQNSPDSGQSVDNLPSKVIRGIKENISPENTLTSSMTNTKTLVEELERQVKTPPLLEISLKVEPKIEEIKPLSDLAPIATIEETEDIIATLDDVNIDQNCSIDSGVVESDKKDKDVDLGKDALSYLMYDNRDFGIGSENVIKTTAPQGSLAQELKEAEIKEILDLSPELVIDESLKDPVFTSKEIVGLRKSPIITERVKLKKANSLEDLSHVEAEKSSPKTKTIAFKVPESTTPRDIPERRAKLRTRSGTSPKSLPESLNKPCPLSKMESILTKKKKKVSSLGKIAKDSLLALNMSEEEIAEFRRSYKLTSVESLKSLESVSEDANSQSGNSVDSRCRSCLRTSQESLMSLDSITEDCRCTDDCEKPGRSAR